MLEHRRPRTRLRPRIAGAIALLAALALSVGAEAASAAPGHLTIVPTFNSSITESPEAAAIETAINKAMARLDRRIITPITVNIEFVNSSAGSLGNSSVGSAEVSYSDYLAALHGTARGPKDHQALSTLPAGPNNPVNGSSTVNLTVPLLRAVGIFGPSEGIDGKVFLDVSLLNLVRAKNKINPENYDLQQVVTHEVVEILGAGGQGSRIRIGAVGSLDLFRYSAPGVRSFTESTSATSYFSIDGGVTNLANFSQEAEGDLADWSESADGFPQVQDAEAKPGIFLNPDNVEYLALDVVGYTILR